MTVMLIVAKDSDAVKREVMNLLFWPEVAGIVTPPEMTCKEIGTAEPDAEPGLIFRADCVRVSVREEKTPVVEVMCQS
jgi:hypothetical protein